MKKHLFLIAMLCPILIIAQPTHDDIMGVWKLKAASWNDQTKEYADCTIYKFITPTRWATIFYRPNTNEFVGSGGGTYHIIDGRYEETLEFFSWDSTGIGSTQTYNMHVNDGTLTQSGHLHTEKYQYDLYEVYHKVDDIHDDRAGRDFITGTWKLKKAQWGTNYRSATDIQSRYGEVLKIITPQYFLSSYFDKDKKTFGGAVFGQHNTSGKDYVETLLSWSWDPKTIGSHPAFTWDVNDGVYRQLGKIDAGDYQDYQIDEYYERCEPIQPAHTLEGRWLLVDGIYHDGPRSHDDGFQFKIFEKGNYSLVMESEDGKWNRLAYGTYEDNGHSFSETFDYTTVAAYQDLVAYWDYYFEGDQLVIEGPVKILDSNGQPATAHQHLLNTMKEYRVRIDHNTVSDSNDKRAIKAVIVTETECAFARKYDCLIDKYVHADYAFQGWNNRDGSIGVANGWQQINRQMKKYFSDATGSTASVHPLVRRSDFQFHFLKPDIALVTWTQYNSNKSKTFFRKSKEQRIMQKVNGQWKIASVVAFWDNSQKIPISPDGE